MGIGTSIFLIAVGAILRYAVTEEVQGVEIQTVGLILMIVGIIGLIITLAMFFASNDRAAAGRVAPLAGTIDRVGTGARTTGLRGRLRRRRPWNLNRVMPAKGR